MAAHRKTRKWRVPAILLLIIVVLISGCSSGNKNKSNDSSSSPSASVDNSSSASASPSASAEASQDKPRGKVSVAVYDGNKIAKDLGTMDKNWATDWIQQNSPVDVDFVIIPRAGDTDKYNTLFAAGNA